MDGGCGWGGESQVALVPICPPTLPVCQGRAIWAPPMAADNFLCPPPHCGALGKEGNKSMMNFFQTSDVQQAKVHCYGRDTKNGTQKGRVAGIAATDVQCFIA